LLEPNTGNSTHPREDDARVSFSHDKGRAEHQVHQDALQHDGEPAQLAVPPEGHAALLAKPGATYQARRLRQLWAHLRAQEVPARQTRSEVHGHQPGRTARRPPRVVRKGHGRHGRQRPRLAFHPHQLILTRPAPVEQIPRSGIRGAICFFGL